MIRPEILQDISVVAQLATACGAMFAGYQLFLVKIWLGRSSKIK